MMGKGSDQVEFAQRLGRNSAAMINPINPETSMRTAQEIVDQTEGLAKWLLKWKWGQEPVSSDVLMRSSPTTRAQYCWHAACDIQEMLTQTDVENALAAIEGAQDG